MTTGMDDRRDAFEKKFALDAELRFKAEARRNKLLGLWAADQLGKKDAEAEAYAKEVVAADFDAASVSVADEVIREKMFAFLEEAIRQVKQD